MAIKGAADSHSILYGSIAFCVDFSNEELPDREASCNFIGRPVIVHAELQ
jgi:hypothetical protein